MTEWVVFTDLDSTLLDRDTYELGEALDALNLLKKLKIPVIAVTTKTFPECLAYKNFLNGVIYESGCGVFWQNRHFKFGSSYESVIKDIEKLKEEIPIIGFNELSVKDISELTGLPPHMAELAKKREFTEPILLLAEGKADELKLKAQKLGYKLLKGGRFYHLIPQNCGKDKAVKWMKERFFPNAKTVGLGDSPLDLPFLKVVDIAAIIPKKDGSYALELKGALKATLSAPAGWKEIIFKLFGGKDGNGY